MCPFPSAITGIRALTTAPSSPAAPTTLPLPHRFVFLLSLSSDVAPSERYSALALSRPPHFTLLLSSFSQ